MMNIFSQQFQILITRLTKHHIPKALILYSSNGATYFAHASLILSNHLPHTPLIPFVKKTPASLGLYGLEGCLINSLSVEFNSDSISPSFQIYIFSHYLFRYNINEIFFFPPSSHVLFTKICLIELCCRSL